MSQLNFHNLILQKSIDAYKIWHIYFQSLPKFSRYSLGNHVDIAFLEFIESIYAGIYSAKINQQSAIQTISGRLDGIRLLLRIAWEVRALDNKKYSALSIPLAEIGKIIGGWQKQSQK